MASSDFRRQLQGYGLTTAHIFYRRPDHPWLLQSYVWQEYDLCPKFPELQRFLDVLAEIARRNASFRDGCAFRTDQAGRIATPSTACSACTDLPFLTSLETGGVDAAGPAHVMLRAGGSRAIWCAFWGWRAIMAPARTKTSARRAAARKAVASRAPNLRTLQRKSAAAPAKRSSQIFRVSHHSEDDFEVGLRRYAKYRDLGMAKATSGMVQAHVIRFVPPCRPEEVSKLHYHDVEFQMIYVLKGWIKTELEGQGAHVMRPGSAWIQPPRIKHKVLDYSDDCRGARDHPAGGFRDGRTHLRCPAAAGHVLRSAARDIHVPTIRFDFGTLTLEAELADTPTAKAVLAKLPYDARVMTWGEEVYFDVPVDSAAREGRARRRDAGRGRVLAGRPVHRARLRPHADQPRETRRGSRARATFSASSPATRSRSPR